ncbi:TDT family transporter [Actinomadura rudentiformis]|uniref:TDT family transporter n=1 Tax=Actinomadura rudentiformis TaxID=359158 RepID=A0A6H9YPP8_9ACTN|nr:TDT family transporter [Actinomadura rudentiformis]KAB2344811.1 TDT family transporter [Actinomadura rudentiformis]
MGTAIIANAADALPVRVPGLHVFAVVGWMMSFVLLVAVAAARGVHLVWHRDEARVRLFDDPATAVFYGCPPMALLAVGYGTLVLGPDVIGTTAAVWIDGVLWTAGTLYSLAVAFGIPYLMITRHRVGSADPTWLLPVVAPMVAAALGPALVPHLPEGEPRALMVYACYAMFGASILAVVVILPGIWSRLVRDRSFTITLVPTLFLVLGPLGQSVTAVNQLADAAPAAAPQYADAMAAFAVLYGTPVIGFALLWLAIAAAASVRALRDGMPFAMTWWAYTFPLGTCVTGASALARRLDLGAMAAIAVGLYLLLLAAWAVTATRTLRGVLAGRLLPPPGQTS